MTFSSGGGGDSYDADYNARMATIAESQQGMASELYDFYKHGTGGAYETRETVITPASKGTRQVASGTFGGKLGDQQQYTTESYDIPAVMGSEQVWVPDGSTSGYRDMEQAQINANMKLIPAETDLNLEKITAERSLLPGQTALSGAQTSAALELLPGQTALAGKTIADRSKFIDERAPVRESFFREANQGVNVEERANRAAADAAHAFMNSSQVSRRDAARMGINPNSGRFAAMQTGNEINRAKAIGGATTQARTQAGNDNFDRLNKAMAYNGG